MNRLLAFSVVVLSGLSLGIAQKTGGDDVRERVRELTEALSDAEPDVRSSAADDLGRIGPQAVVFPVILAGTEQ